MSLDHEFADGSGGSTQGREFVRAGWRGYFAFCPYCWVKPDEAIVGDNCVIAIGEAGGTHLEAGTLPAGNEWRIPAAWRAAIKGGLLEHWHVYADNKPAHDIFARRQLESQ